MEPPRSWFVVGIYTQNIMVCTCGAAFFEQKSIQYLHAAMVIQPETSHSRSSFRAKTCRHKWPKHQLASVMRNPVLWAEFVEKFYRKNGVILQPPDDLVT